MPGKILIVDDIATNRIVLKVKLSSAFYEVLQARNGIEALNCVLQQRPDLILIAAELPDMDAITFCKRLRQTPEYASIPVVSLANECNSETRIAALAAGIDDILTSPVDDVLLLARLRSLLRSRDTAEELRLREVTDRALGFAEEEPRFERPAHVTLVSSNRAEVFRWKKELGGQTSHILTSVDMKDTMRHTPNQATPDIFVVALGKDDAEDGLRLLADIRASSGSRHAAVIAVLKDNDRTLAADALDLGANDLMPQSFGPKELALRIDAQLKRKRMGDRLRANMRDGLRAAVIDPLTGLYNRRYAMPHLARMAETARKTGRRYTIMLADLDHFKRVNDTYGHAAGDTVLVAVANQLRDNLRDVDMIARIGGEEFLIAMPETDHQEARVAARRLCRVIQKLPIDVPGLDIPIHVTVSIGVAVGTVGTTESAPNIAAILDQADKALYGAKSDGRNQVTFSERPAA